jgi:hypothetical protein
MNPMITPDTPVANNRIHVTAEIAFNECGGAEGWLHVKTAGQLAFYETVRNDGAEDFIEHWTDGLFATPELKDARILHQQPDWVEGRADLTFEPVEDTIDGMIRIDLPWNVTDFHGLLPHNLALHHPDRSVPVFMDHVGSVETSLTFTYPEEMIPVLLPEPFQGNLSGVSLSRQVITNGGSVTIHEKAGFKEAVIPAEDWDSFSQLLLNADLPASRTLLLKTEK